MKRTYRNKSTPPLPLLAQALVCAAVLACGDDGVGPTMKLEGGAMAAPLDGGVAGEGGTDSAAPIRGGTCDDDDAGTECPEEQNCIAGRCVFNVCGDGVKAGDEACDDGNVSHGDGCDPACRLEMESCGDSRVQEPEECDDGNRFDLDGCSNACTWNECGNQRLDGMEECDDGDLIDDNECSNACTENRCRNGRVDPGEECDDGNRIHTDGCSNACTIIECRNGELEGPEECDDGNQVDDDDCSNVCTANECGNLRIDPGEVCDQAIGCSDDCTMLEEDRCAPCEQEKCNGYLGFINAYDGCFENNPNPEATSVPQPMLAQLCIDAMTCARENGCGFEMARPAAACYCGSRQNGECAANGPADDAPCVAEFQAATGQTQPATVLALLASLDAASGWVYYMMSCDMELCAEECVPATANGP